jgi:hypothetical protein
MHRQWKSRGLIPIIITSDPDNPAALRRKGDKTLETISHSRRFRATTSHCACGRRPFDKA